MTESEGKMTQQEMRAQFFAKTGRIATMESVEYQAFIWGVEFGAATEREACAKVCDSIAENAWSTGEVQFADKCAAAIRERSNSMVS